MGMKQQLPVKKNEVYTIEITDQGHEGQGVGKVNGFTIFIYGALPGEKVEVKIVKVTSSYAYGKILNILKPSPARVEPFCSVYKRCGGCHLQHMSYEAQLEFKTNRVKEVIRRIGGLENVNIKDVIGMYNPLNYRNKAQYPVGILDNRVVIGFYANRTHEIIPSESCMIQHPRGVELANLIKDFIIQKGIPIYDEKTGKGVIRHIVTRVGFATGETMIIVVANTDRLPFGNELVDYVKQKAPIITSIIHNINKKNTNVILGEENIVLYGKDHIIDQIEKYKFKISPLSFFQVNPLQTEVLYKQVVKYAELTGSEIVFDLYSGIGTISLFLSEKAKKVYGIEVVEDAVKDAVENAKLNCISNVEFIAGEVEKVVPDLKARGISPDVVILDPPRKGCEKELLGVISEIQPKRIIYVSCNPSTLARDLKILDGLGFKTEEVQPVDMFPHTYHVECVVLLKRKSSL